MRRRRIWCALAGLALAATGCGVARAGEVALPTGGVHIAGASLVNRAGRPVQLGGVSVSGPEYECLSKRGVFAGPSGSAEVSALAAWHVDAVRIPLNEDCWLGINGLPAGSTASSYQSVVAAFVSRVERHGMVAVLDLHWSAPGSLPARGQQEMPDADHSGAFWRDVGGRYGQDPHVLFELYNEPYGVTWSCWRDGCVVPPAGPTPAYRAAGMQQLVDVVRAAGARNPLLVDGLGHATDLQLWSASEPVDPARSLVAAWHVYGPGGCGPGCWQKTLSELAGVPVVVTELGETDCGSAFVTPLMGWLDAHQVGYLAWAWNTWAGCGGPSLLTSYSGAPHGAYGLAVKEHLTSRWPRT